MDIKKIGAAILTAARALLPTPLPTKMPSAIFRIEPASSPMSVGKNSELKSFGTGVFPKSSSPPVFFGGAVFSPFATGLSKVLWLISQYRQVKERKDGENTLRRKVSPVQHLPEGATIMGDRVGVFIAVRYSEFLRFIAVEMSVLPILSQFTLLKFVFLSQFTYVCCKKENDYESVAVIGNLA